MNQRGYLSYLLRLWETRDGEKEVWRASLENPGSGERLGFASLEDLYCFLNAQTDVSNPPGSDERSHSPR